MKPKLVRVAMPPTDAELADAERHQLARDQSHIEQAEDEREQRTLAKAGDPDAQAALAATASMIQSRPVEHDDDTEEPGNRRTAPRHSRTHRRNAKTSAGTAVAPADNGAPKERDLPTDAAQAYKLMDLAFRKWAHKFKSDPRGANRDLAQDLGADTAIYHQCGIVRLGDMLDSLNKLTALAKPKEDEPEGGDIETEMESMRAALRGGV